MRRSWRIFSLGHFYLEQPWCGPWGRVCTTSAAPGLGKSLGGRTDTACCKQFCLSEFQERRYSRAKCVHALWNFALSASFRKKILACGYGTLKRQGTAPGGTAACCTALSSLLRLSPSLFPEDSLRSPSGLHGFDSFRQGNARSGRQRQGIHHLQGDVIFIRLNRREMFRVNISRETHEPGHSSRHSSSSVAVADSVVFPTPQGRQAKDPGVG